MGDGEVGVSGVEVSGKVTVTVSLHKGLTLTNPVLINAEHVSTIASAQNLEEAVNQAVIDMADLLQARLSLDRAELAMLLSVIGHVQICQVVDPLKTARFVVPRKALEDLGFTWHERSL